MQSEFTEAEKPKCDVQVIFAIKTFSKANAVYACFSQRISNEMMTNFIENQHVLVSLSLSVQTKRNAASCSVRYSHVRNFIFNPFILILPASIACRKLAVSGLNSTNSPSLPFAAADAVSGQDAVNLRSSDA